MGHIQILHEQCSMCQGCVTVCPTHAISFQNNAVEILNHCTLCGICLSSCKQNAIQIIKDDIAQELDISHYRGVWIFCEHNRGELRAVTAELLGEGYKLAKNLGVELSAILIGDELEEMTMKAIAYGAEKVYRVSHPSLSQYHDELYTDIMNKLINMYKPEIVLVGATANGKSLAPRVASKLNTGLTADCTSLEIKRDDRTLLQTRPACGGNLIATITCPKHRPQLCTVRPRVMKPLPYDKSRRGEIIEPKIQLLNDLRTKIEGVIRNRNCSVNLSESDIIVAGGRGMGNSDNFNSLHELASTLGGVVGATRAVVDAGWIGYSHQIGQTGKTVSPKLYFACGISGEMQHIAGMSSADIIVAINSDENAPIFKVANYGIIGDASETVKALIQECNTFLNK